MDPDEPDGADPQVLNGLKKFIIEDLSETEKKQFFSKTLNSITESALNLKALKPVDGLRFSLQQEGEHSLGSYILEITLQKIVYT